MSVTTLHNYFFDSTDYDSGTGKTIYDQISTKDLVLGGNLSNKVSWSTENPFNTPPIYSIDYNGSQTLNQSFKVSLDSPYITTDFSLALWFKPGRNDGKMDSNEAFFSSDDSRNNNNFQIGAISNNTNTIHVVVKNGNSTSFEIGDYTIGEWNHVAITCQNPGTTSVQLKTYLNGNLTNTYTPSSEDPGSVNIASYGFNIEKLILGINRNENTPYDGQVSLLSVYSGILTPTEVSNLDTSNASPCYHSDTLITTNKGEIPIKQLKRRDLIKTRNGFQPLSKVIKGLNIDYKFVKFPKNCLGDNIPNKDLLLTIGHPIFFKGEYYNSDDFIGYQGIEMVTDATTYVFHLQFDSHEVLWSNNLTTTSIPHNTSYQDRYLRKEEYIDPSKYREQDIGKIYPPYNLHKSPVPSQTEKLFSLLQVKQKVTTN